MKKELFLLPILFAVISCGSSNQTNSTIQPEETIEMVSEQVEDGPHVYPYFAGEKFDVSLAVNAAEAAALLENFDGNRQALSFTSQIKETCQKKGCWMKVGMGDEEIRVSFKDYDFFVPLDSEGHQTTLNGEMYYDTLTVAQLKHYALDANATQDSLDKITEPVITLSFEATGVYVD